MYQPTAVFQHVRARISTLFYIKMVEHDLTNIVITQTSIKRQNQNIKQIIRVYRDTIRTFNRTFLNQLISKNDKRIFGNGKIVRSQHINKQNGKVQFLNFYKFMF